MENERQQLGISCYHVLNYAIAKLLFVYSGSPLTLRHVQVGTVRRAVEKGNSNSATSKYQDTSRTNLYSAQDNDDFISSESDRQQLLMR
jgi:hypothetical protein